MQLRHVIARDIIYLRICPGSNENVLCFSLANMHERDGLTLAMATSSRMIQKAVVVVSASTYIQALEKLYQAGMTGWGAKHQKKISEASLKTGLNLIQVQVCVLT